jgi:peptidoglycan/xylan/chitin deacetylase (PgdA/CDA1 family)
VALTFDDGPHPETTPAILELLRQHNCTATFFFTGIRAAAYRDLVARTVDAGHDVYGHGWDHVNLEQAPGPTIVAAMERVEAVLREFRTTPDVYLVRLPYNSGAKRSRIHALTGRFHPDTRFAWWTITTRDWLLARGCTNPADLARRCAAVGRELEELPRLPGSLVLMHEAPFGAEGSLSPRVAPMLLSEILEALVRRGLNAGPIAIDTTPTTLERFLCWHPEADRPLNSVPGGSDHSILDRLRHKGARFILK